MKSPLKIGFLSSWNPYDRQNFSGTVFYMRQALKMHPHVAELRVLGGHRKLLPATLERIAKRLVPGRRARFREDIALTRAATEGLDAIVAPVSSGLVAAYGPSLSAPVIFATDATPQFLEEFYGKPQTTTQRDIEARALRVAAATAYSSHYMASRARAEFPDTPKDRLHTVPFGLNIDSIPNAPPVKPPLSPLNLVFIGKDWVRKGGPLGIDICRLLQERGRDVALTVIGSTVPESHQLKRLKNYPALNKNRPRERDLFTAALAEGHFLILPTRADCTPMVIAEANAFGCPAIVTDTGGIGTLVEEGRNGCLLPYTAGAEQWADTIERQIVDHEIYNQFSQSSFRFCRSRLTWTAWVDDILSIVRDLKTTAGAPSA